MSDRPATKTFSAETLKRPEIREDPYPLYRELWETGRAIPTEIGGLALTHHADVIAALRHPKLSSSNEHEPGNEEFRKAAIEVGFGDLIEQSDHTLLFLDPPDHTRLRKLVAQTFTPRTIEAMRPRIRVLVDELLDVALARPDGFDLVDDLAYLLPVTVISEMLGVPLADQAQLRAWTAVATRALDPNSGFEGMDGVPDALRGLRAYFEDLITLRRAEPGDDLLTALIAVEEAGERLTHDELRATIVLLYGAGHETTVNLIGNGIVALLRHPDQWRRLCDDPSLAPGAVEEALRYDSPVQLTGRLAVETVDLDGIHVDALQNTLLLLGAANRDPDVFADPDRFDITRVPNDQTAFGGGIHFCLGAALARVEGQEAFTALAQRAPTLGLASDTLPRKETVTLRGFASVPVRVG